MSIRKVLVILIVALASLAGTRVYAQKDFKGTIAKWTDQSKPGILKVNLLNGNVTIKTYNGKDAIITSHTTDDGSGNLVGHPTAGEIDGLKWIGGGFRGLAIFNDEKKVISVLAVLPNRRVDLDIQVPVKTNLNIHMNAGNLTVDGVEGEIESTTLNGAVTLTNVAGSVVAHSMNGTVVASLREVPAKKAMSFTSMNGNVDVTLPSTAKAALKIRTDHGEVYSDFDIKLPPSSQSPGGPITKDGTINNGGPDVELRAFNGNIFIRKRTK